MQSKDDRIQDQFDYFKPELNDFKVLFENKSKFSQLLEELWKKHKLVKKRLEDFVDILEKIEHGQAVIHICKDKTNKQSSDIKAIRELPVDMENNGGQLLREIQYGCLGFDHPNLIKYEEVFFEKKNDFVFVYLVMPFIKFTFSSWLLPEEKLQQISLKSIQMNGTRRTFAEVRSVLTQILSGLDHIHSKKLVYVDHKV